jgi:hypothetical protein
VLLPVRVLLEQVPEPELLPVLELLPVRELPPVPLLRGLLLRRCL